MPIFGYLLVAALFLGAVVLAGILCAIKSTRRRSSPVPWIFGGLLVLLGVCVVNEIRWEALEWNPSIPDDAAVMGVWQDSNHRVVLGPDHRFTYRVSSQEMEGTWNRDDWNLYLHNSRLSGQMRFVQMWGRYRLMTNPPEDPDEWNGDAGLRQVQR